MCAVPKVWHFQCLGLFDIQGFLGFHGNLQLVENILQGERLLALLVSFDILSALWMGRHRVVRKLFCGILYRGMVLRVLRFRLRVNGLHAFDVPPKAEAHGLEHFFSDCVLAPRTKAGVKRRGYDVGRNLLFKRGLDRPTALPNPEQSRKTFEAAHPARGRRRQDQAARTR